MLCMDVSPCRAHPYTKGEYAPYVASGPIIYGEIASHHRLVLGRLAPVFFPLPCTYTYGASEETVGVQIKLSCVEYDPQIKRDQ